jgi:hypothetical protein
MAPPAASQPPASAAATAEAAAGTVGGLQAPGAEQPGRIAERSPSRPDQAFKPQAMTAKQRAEAADASNESKLDAVEKRPEDWLKKIIALRVDGRHARPTPSSSASASATRSRAAGRAGSGRHSLIDGCLERVHHAQQEFADFAGDRAERGTLGKLLHRGRIHEFDLHRTVVGLAHDDIARQQQADRFGFRARPPKGGYRRPGSCEAHA